MRPSSGMAVVHRNTPRSEPWPQDGMRWGLSARLPRWHTFDDRRSQVAPAWATTNERQIVKRLTVLALTLAVAAALPACSRDLQAMDAQQIEQKYGVAGGVAE